MTPGNYNNNEFTHGIYINATAGKVFEYAATSSGISKWFIGNCKYYYKDNHIRLGHEFAEKGDSFLWKWLNKDLELKGMVLEAVRDELFQFTFSPLYIVTIKLTSDKGKTRLTLRHEYQDSAVKDEFNFINCCVCWVFFLTNLKSVIENGADLRETDIADEILVNF